ncbi:hypothetical protein COU74_02435 [Candidatus Peregrinibacteria bacterium CG10_big_fil_rev_8_21_14_0_10_36_19]|nr:MAG: hypothetical protein COU74_02435 [Candidatus Peregrinibacteria bacterium CG10_big_fil_rev_8_21_14_0_10_36_19]
MSLKNLAPGESQGETPKLHLVSAQPLTPRQVLPLSEITLFPSVYRGLDSDQQNALSNFAEDQRNSLRGGRVKDIAREGAVNLDGYTVAVNAALLNVVNNANWLEGSTTLKAMEEGKTRAMRDAHFDTSLRTADPTGNPDGTTRSELSALGLARAVEHGLQNVVVGNKNPEKLFHPDYLSEDGYPAADAAVLRLAYLLALTCGRTVDEVLESAPFKDCINPLRRKMLQLFERDKAYGL